MDMTEQENLEKTILQTFVTSIIESKNKPKTLLINASNFNLFAGLASPNVIQISRAEEISSDIKFDIILGDLPFGMY